VTSWELVDPLGSRLDLVLINYHSATLLGRTIRVARTFAGNDVRLILVDNSPGDGAADIVRADDPDATIILNDNNLGFAAAVNQAFEAGEREFALILNPDVRSISGTYDDVLEAFREPSVGAVVTQLVDTEGVVQPHCIQAPRPFDLISEDLALVERFPRWERPRRYRMLDWDHGDVRRVDAATGACLFIRRTAVDDVGLLDERFFFYYEETDWLIRAKRRGWQTLFLPMVAAVHESEASSPGAPLSRSLLLLESQHRYARKHFGLTRSAILRGTLCGIDLARLARHTLSGRADARKTSQDRICVHVTGRAPRPP
jgi:GT2 family glycosyltransferase